MIVALDVKYNDSQSRATAAAIVFSQWHDAAPCKEYTAVCPEHPALSGRSKDWWPSVFRSAGFQDWSMAKPSAMRVKGDRWSVWPVKVDNSTALPLAENLPEGLPIEIRL